jgi:hypothetical protein
VKRRVLLIALSVVIMTVSVLASCTPKKSSSSSGEVAVSTVSSRLDALEANARSFADQLNALKSVTTTPATAKDWQPAINTVQSTLADQINQLRLQSVTPLAALQSSVDKLNTQWTALSNTQTTDETTLTTLQKTLTDQVTKALADLKTVSAPRYAIVTDVGRKYIDIDVYGAGTYPVIVNIYGDKLLTGEVNTLAADTYSVTDETVLGTYVLTPMAGVPATISSATFPVTISGVTGATGSVTISGLTVNDIPYSIVFNGKQLTVVVEPDKAWLASDTISLDIRDLSGSVSYATANVGSN